MFTCSQDRYVTLTQNVSDLRFQRLQKMFDSSYLDIVTPVKSSLETPKATPVKSSIFSTYGRVVVPGGSDLVFPTTYAKVNVCLILV